MNWAASPKSRLVGGDTLPERLPAPGRGGRWPPVSVSVVGSEVTL
jgi:hypothetical protein